MSKDKSISNFLTGPLSPDWTVDGLAEQILNSIAGQTSTVQEFVLDSETTTNRQSQRLLRPLLACLAVMSSAESGNPVNIYGGNLSFKRQGPEGPVWILAQFENKPGNTHVVFRRSPKDS